MIFFWFIPWTGRIVNPIRLSAWRPFLLVLSVVAGAVTGCGKPAMVGLRPDYPPVERKWHALLAEFVEVDSLTPTFRWQPLDRVIMDPSVPCENASTESVTYEIRIWRTVTRGAGKLVYAKSQLTAPEHRLERPLDPGTRYYWSVRAHLAINGRLRVTEWALAGYLLRGEAVPNDSCLRFTTPANEIIQ